MNLTSTEIDNYLTELLATKEFASSTYDRQVKVKPSQKKHYQEYLKQVETRDKKHLKPIFDDFVDVAIFPSSIHINTVGQKFLKTNKRLGVGAQNCYYLNAGAVTGEVSAGQLGGLVDYVLIGHSERRSIFNETDETINLKLKAVIDNGMTAVLCVGETRQQYERGETKAVIERQISAGLDGVNAKKLNQDWLVQKIIVAYEPVWAIGSGLIPDFAEIAQTVKLIKSKAHSAVLYGGSVNEQNVAEILSTAGIDGLLVGGASLNPQKFATIVEIARNWEGK
jgi:triosephosphate isomerase